MLWERVDRWFKDHGRYRCITDRDGKSPYIHRYYLLGNYEQEEHNRKFNVFIHRIVLSDEPVYHDHPWWFISFILKGSYIEHRPLWIRSTPIVPEGFVTDVKKTRKMFSLARREATDFHWLELPKGKEVWTLFIHGPRIRKWGFLNMHEGQLGYPSWMYWKDYLARRRSV